MFADYETLFVQRVYGKQEFILDKAVRVLFRYCAATIFKIHALYDFNHFRRWRLSVSVLSCDVSSFEVMHVNYLYQLIFRSIDLCWNNSEAL